MDTAVNVEQDHVVTEDIHESILTPGHAPRVESAAYAKVHRKLVKLLDLPCIVCGVRNSTLTDPAANRFNAKLLETHHRFVEWSLMNAVDLDKFNSRVLPYLHHTHPDEALYDKPFDRRTLNAWVDHHPHNLWVICDVHHVGQNTGIHYLAAPIWGVQDLLLDQYQQEVMRQLLMPHNHNLIEEIEMNQTVENFKAHIPAYLATALVVVNALLDANVIHLSGHVVDFVNSILVALGLGVLHVRQQAAMRLAKAQSRLH